MKPYKHILGIFGSMILLWTAGTFFCDSPYILVPHPALETVGYPEGSSITWRSEGCGRSYFGTWGLAAIPDIRKQSEPKIILWGDSYVQALQVDDDKKMAQQLTQILKTQEGVKLLAIGAGVAGQSAADYLLRIPAYERQIAPISAHIIVIGQIEDLFPDQASAHFARFVSRPHLHITPYHPRPLSRAKYAVYEWGVLLRANGLVSLLRRYSGGIKLRFSMGPPARVEESEVEGPSSETTNIWFEYLAKEFQRTTDKPLILVYAPTVPRLSCNGWDEGDMDAAAASQMRRIFSENGWMIVDMGPRFIEHFKETGELSRGFINSSPGSGHLNETGHRLVAEETADCLIAALQETLPAANEQ